jgi:uncharacterized membrane protein (UPF0127 family)
MKKFAFFTILFLSGCNDPFINLPPTKAIFTYEKHSFYALHLYRSEDQEIGFKNNPEKLPVVFTWSKPINICFNMENVNLELYIYYLDKNKQMIGKDLMTANSKNQYCPPDKISYAIESINPL